MLSLRMFLGAVLLVIAAYTSIVIANDGINLFPHFFLPMAEFGWQGQFNLDFMFMLALSALWTAWRNRFTPAGIGLGILAFFLGAPFLCVYLIVLSYRESGDLRRMLIGQR